MVDHHETLMILSVQGADFGSSARKQIEEKLRSGMTLDEIEWRLKGHDKPPPPKQQQQPQQQQRKPEAAAAQVVEAPPAAPAKKEEPKIEVGESMGVAGKRDPLSMIKVWVQRGCGAAEVHMGCIW